MSTDPLPDSSTRNVDNDHDTQTENEKFWHRPRWHQFGGKKPPMSAARVEAIKRKRAWDDVRNKVPPSKCLSGDELVAERKHVGDGTSFRFATVSDDRAKLRWLDAMILAAVTYAMLCRKNGDGSPCKGLVATIGELALFTGAGKTAVREAACKLVALGLLTCDVTFVKFHAVTNQRGNLYRVTTQAVHAYALYVPDGVQLEAGVVTLGSRGLRNPVANPDLGRKREKTLNSSGMATACEKVVGCADADLFRTVVPDVAAVPSQPVTRQASSCDVVGKAPDRTSVREILDEDLRDLLGPCAVRFAKAGAL